MAEMNETESKVVDPIAIDLVRNALETAADEMAVTIQRTARSFVLKEAMDYSTALFNGKGELLAQGTCLPLHLGAMPEALRAVRAKHDLTMAEGDVYILNDPFEGGTHLPDVILIKPVYLDETILGFAAALAHQTDIGGRVAGSNACDSTEIYQEGLRIPPIKLCSKGCVLESIMQLISKNVRVPDMVLGDIRSLLSAVEIGEKALLKLVANYGVEEFDRLCNCLLEYAEEFTRNQISVLNDGEYKFTDYLDGDGVDEGPITIDVKITVKNDSVLVDFSGTDSQVKGAINCVLPTTRSVVYACIRSMLDRRIPNNSGFFKPIEVTAPPKTVVSAEHPVAVAARGLTAFRIGDAVYGALAQIVPDKVPAAGVLADTGISVGGGTYDGNPFVFVDFLVGSWGGSAHRDGMDGCTGTLINYSNTPVELIEAENPIVIEEYAYLSDSGGAGKFRGGLGIARSYRFEVDGLTLQLRSDRRDIPPYGLNGGLSGKASNAIYERRGQPGEQLPSKCLINVQKGDRLRLLLPGGGGYGSPCERSTQDIIKDVEEEKVTLAEAKRVYGFSPDQHPDSV